MDHQEIEERQIIERYVMATLGGDDVAAFEEHYLGCDRCLEELELAERFRHALQGVVAEEAGRSAVRLGIVAALARLHRGARGLLTAALAAIVLVPSFFLWRLAGDRSRLLEELGRPPQPVVAKAVLALAPVRSGAGLDAPVHRLDLSAEPEWIGLALHVGSPAVSPVKGERYRVELVGPDGETAWRSGELRADASGTLSLNVHSSFLAAGDHRIAVEEVAPGGEARSAAHFAFRVTREE
jgi:hypothetical protein